jgi:hypothetical protein
MEGGTVALLGVRAGPSIRLVCLPLGLPTTSARAPQCFAKPQEGGFTARERHDSRGRLQARTVHR